MDWPVTWDNEIVHLSDPVWQRYMRRLWLARWQAMQQVLCNVRDSFGAQSVKALLPRLRASTTAMQVAAILASKMPEHVLASFFNSDWEKLPSPLMVIDSAPGSVPEGYIHVHDGDEGQWVCAQLTDCAVLVAPVLLEVIIDQMCGCSGASVKGAPGLGAADDVDNTEIVGD